MRSNGANNNRNNRHARNNGVDDETGALPIVARGIGGRIELWENEIRVIKGGVFGHLVEILWLGQGRSESTLFLDQIAAVKIERNMVLPDIIQFSYAGGPVFTGDYLHDALAENALLMNLFDNRKFSLIKAAVEDSIVARRVRPALAPPNRRSRRPAPRGRGR
jgi:hypothetical protein